MQSSHKAALSKTTVELPELLHRKLRVKAAVERRTINDIVVECLQDCFGNLRIDPDSFEVETVTRHKAPKQLRPPGTSVDSTDTPADRTG